MVLLFHYLSLLNIFDGFITYFGLEKSLIQEMNPLMLKIYEAEPSMFLIIKIVFSLCLYMFILFKRVPKSSLTKGLTVFASCFYTLIFFLHCYWVVVLM